MATDETPLTSTDPPRCDSRPRQAPLHHFSCYTNGMGAGAFASRIFRVSSVTSALIALGCGDRATKPAPAMVGSADGPYGMAVLSSVASAQTSAPRPIRPFSVVARRGRYVAPANDEPTAPVDEDNGVFQGSDAVPLLHSGGQIFRLDPAGRLIQDPTMLDGARPLSQWRVWTIRGSWPDASEFEGYGSNPLVGRGRGTGYESSTILAWQNHAWARRGSPASDVHPEIDARYVLECPTVEGGADAGVASVQRYFPAPEPWLHDHGGLFAVRYRCAPAKQPVAVVLHWQPGDSAWTEIVLPESLVQRDKRDVLRIAIQDREHFTIYVSPSSWPRWGDSPDRDMPVPVLVRRYDKGVWSTVALPERSCARDVIYSSDGTLWLATPSGLFYENDGEVRRSELNSPDSPPLQPRAVASTGENVWVLAEGTQGETYVLTQRTGAAESIVELPSIRELDERWRERGEQPSVPSPFPWTSACTAPFVRLAIDLSGSAKAFPWVAAAIKGQLDPTQYNFVVERLDAQGGGVQYLGATPPSAEAGQKLVAVIKAAQPHNPYVRLSCHKPRFFNQIQLISP